MVWAGLREAREELAQWGSGTIPSPEGAKGGVDTRI